MEGRENLDYYRNTTEELFIKSMVETSVGISPPTMEMLGFRNLTQSFRTDSEELFKSWLKNGESNGCGSATIATRTRSASRRITTEPSNLSNQQNEGMLQKQTEEIEFQQNSSNADEALHILNQHSVKNAAETGLQASNLFLAKAWFQSSQPMTRSRSSELRKRYVAMQNFQSCLGLDSTLLNSVPENGVNQDEYTNPNGFSHMVMNEGANQLNEFASPSNSSSSAFNAQQMQTADNISSVVGMLKGTIERKKLCNNPDKEAVDESFFGYYDTEVLDHMNFYERQDHTFEIRGNLPDVALLQESETDGLHEVQGSFNANLVSVNPTQLSVVSQEPSHSGSSAAAAVFSTTHDAYDDPSNSVQEATICQTSRKQNGNARGRAYDNSRQDGKKQPLVRHGSVTSAVSVDLGDPTKKRRVERSKKMAEAKGRNAAPAIPSDMQSLLKRCENLEKEVRSLKLNLAFMNRKDSEQTKQIEELQKENKELGDEKERLLEEIERVIT